MLTDYINFTVRSSQIYVKYLRPLHFSWFFFIHLIQHCIMLHWADFIVTVCLSFPLAVKLAHAHLSQQNGATLTEQLNNMFAFQKSY